MLKIWKKRLIQLEKKIRDLNNHKLILINIFNEVNKEKNVKLDYLLHDIDLREDISYLDDWGEFYSKYVEKYKNRIRKLKQINEETSEIQEKENAKLDVEKDVQDSFKFVFREINGEKQKLKVPEIKFEHLLQKKAGIKHKISNTIEKIFKEVKSERSLRYGALFVILTLMITGLFLLKPSITGHVVLSKESTYNESLNLKINESGNYTWKLSKPGTITSIRATGSVSGNGTVKIYIEKDGKRYLILDNKMK